MNVNRKNAAVKKYADTYKLDQDKAISEMTEKGYTQEEIFEITEAIAKGETKTPEEPKAKAAKKEVAKGGANSIFEKWKVSVNYERDEEGEPIKDKKGRPIPVFEKEKHLRDVTISDVQAETLNLQSVNSLLKYYPKK